MDGNNHPFWWVPEQMSPRQMSTCTNVCLEKFLPGKMSTKTNITGQVSPGQTAFGHVSIYRYVEVDSGGNFMRSLLLDPKG